ncbi:hypothetical protein [Pseudogemmobacter sonorensis]|uniref:hypothetical protein n=1 Tax=Pseudogemmobacter sonorensis TaxID=2989681 RepID=UPI0036D18A56
MIGPISRILARWLASALVTYGLVAPQYGAALDHDLALVLGALIGAGTEAAYALAKRRGWST